MGNPVRYANGKIAKGQCMRCGHVVPYKKLSFDDYVKNLLVCPDCYEDEHPQDKVDTKADAIVLSHPAPLLDDVPVDSDLLVDSLEGGTTFGGGT